MTRRVLRRPLGAASVVFLAALLLAVLAAPLVGPVSPLEQDLRHVLATPSWTHPLGTDNLGRDVLSRLLYGGRVTMLGVAEAVGVVLLLGVPLGLVAGYVGERIDALVLHFSDIALSIPVIITLLVVLATFGQNETAAMVTFGALGTPGMIRVVRSAAIAVRPEPFVTAARVAGLTAPQIIRRHVLPRVAGPVIVQTSLFAALALITESGLAFLGLGAQEPAPSWGGMVAAASNVISQDPWLLVPPGALIGVTVLALGLLGDAVRDAVTDRPAARRGRPYPAPAPTAIQAPGALLSVDGFSVAFPGPSAPVTVVQHVSFEVREGETVGLVGESGCGKTVTARAILGLLADGGEVTAGSCRFNGEELVGLGRRGYSALRGREIALAPQEPVASLDPNLRIGVQLAQVVQQHQSVKRALARERALELLERVRLRDPLSVARRYPHELSGGMAQRVAIAAALAGEPRLLIADEPTTALDVTVQAEILDLLCDLQQTTRMSILLVTHDWGVVADICDRAVVMYAGEVVEQANVGAMFHQPLHPYTDGLLHSNPHAVPVGEPLRAIAGTVPAPQDWPGGCRFSPRCPLSTAVCRTGPVAMAEPAPGRQTRCLHHDRLLVRAGS